MASKPRAAGSVGSMHSNNSADRTPATEEEKRPGQLEEVAPPEWRSVLSLDTDLGYPDFYPSHPGSHQPTHVLTPLNIKIGFSSPTVSSINQNSESFSIHHIINEKIRTRDVLERATDFARLVMEAKGRRVGGGGLGAKQESGLPPYTFKPPSRAILNPLMRSLFLQDLANPQIPLESLAKNRSLPSGLKGMDMLEILWEKGVDVGIMERETSNGVMTQGSTGEDGGSAMSAGKGKGRMLDRAAWLVHVVGGHEVQALRNKMSSTTYNNPFPNLAPSEIYSIEFTGLFITWLSRQLTELTLPVSVSGEALADPSQSQSSLSSQLGVGSQGAMRSALNVSNATRDVLSAGETSRRGAWARKWDYSVALLRTLLDRPRLIHNATLWLNLAHLLEHANFLQIGFVVGLVREFASNFAIVQSEGGMMIAGRRMLRTMVRKSVEIREHPLRSRLATVEMSLGDMTKAAWDIGNDSIFASPFMWRLDGEFLLSTDSPLRRSIEDFGLQLQTGETSRLARIKRNADRFLKQDAAQLQRTMVAKGGREKRHLGALKEIDKMSSVEPNERMEAIYLRYFEVKDKAKIAAADLVSKSHDLLHWVMSATTEQLAIRIEAAACLLQRLDGDQIIRQHNMREGSSEIDVEGIILDWLINQGQSHQPSLTHIARLGAALQASSLLSYMAYINRLIALGLTAIQQGPMIAPAPHLDILRAIPIFRGSPQLYQQQALALNGFPQVEELVICDSPAGMSSPSGFQESSEAITATVETFQAATRRLSALQPDVDPSRHRRSTDPRRSKSGTKISSDETKAMWDLCYAGICQLGEIIAGQTDSSEAASLWEARKKAQPILDLLAAASERTRSPSKGRTRALAPLLRIIQLVSQHLQRSQGAEPMFKGWQMEGLLLDIMRGLLLVQDGLWPEFWPSIDVAMASSVLGALEMLAANLSSTRNAASTLATEIFAGYVEAMGKEHPCLHQNSLKEFRQACPTGAGRFDRLLDTSIGTEPPTISWRSPLGKHAGQPSESTFWDRAWDHVPVSVGTGASIMSPRDDIVDFSVPTNAGTVSLDIFGAIHTGDRVSSGAQGSNVKLLAERDLKSGNSGSLFAGAAYTEEYSDVRVPVASVTSAAPPISSLEVIEISDEEDSAPVVQRKSSRRMSGESATEDSQPPSKKQRIASVSQRSKMIASKQVAPARLAKQPAAKRKGTK